MVATEQFLILFILIFFFFSSRRRHTRFDCDWSSDVCSSDLYTNSKLIYVGTEFGKAYRLTNSGGTWTATAIHAAPLPERHYIWDIAPRPDKDRKSVV